MLASEITAVLTTMLASSVAALQTLLRQTGISAEMVRIFSKQIRGWQKASICHTTSPIARGGIEKRGQDVDLSKLSDEELLRQLQLAREKLLHGRC